MFNIGGMELIVILLVALIVLGPDKLPEAARKAGQMMSELRKMSAGFKKEIQGALDEGTAMVNPAKSVTDTFSKTTPSKSTPARSATPDPKKLTEAPADARPIDQTPSAPSGSGNGSAGPDAGPTDTGAVDEPPPSPAAGPDDGS